MSERNSGKAPKSKWYKVASISQSKKYTTFVHKYKFHFEENIITNIIMFLIINALMFFY